MRIFRKARPPGSAPGATSGRQGPGPVSSEDKLILVNANDEVVGFQSKRSCHDGDGLLHRGFSVYLFDAERRLLIQKRSRYKRLWPLYWSNSCCSHPRWGEETDAAVRRRIPEELGLSAELRRVCAFEYRAAFGEVGSEHEFCAVYVGAIRGRIRPQAQEVADWRFAEAEELDQCLALDDSLYTPWFRIGWRRLREEHWHETLI